MISMHDSVSPPSSIGELFPGLVLFVDPAVLRLEGALCQGHQVRDDHYFLCVLVDEESGETFWIPLSSKPRHNRLPISGCEKHGHPDWVGTRTHAVVDQIWLARPAVVWEAARVALDQSRAGVRNTVTDDALSRVLDAATTYGA